MFKIRHFKDEINPKDIKEKIILIPDSNKCYISENGNVYKTLSNGYLFKKKLSTSCGYNYTSIIMENGKSKTFRVHRLVASMFIPNPNNYDVVGHKDNKKTNNIVSNLYWTTISENTQKAFDDGLIENAKGYDDSQSLPIHVYKDGIFYKDFGSVKECVREMKIPQTTILRRCHNNKEGKHVTYRKFKEYDFKFQ